MTPTLTVTQFVDLLDAAGLDTDAAVWVPRSGMGILGDEAILARVLLAAGGQLDHDHAVAVLGQPVRYQSESGVLRGWLWPGLVLEHDDGAACDDWWSHAEGWHDPLMSA